MEGIVLNFWTALFLAAAAQGFFLAFVLFTSSRKNSPNYLLSSLIFLFSVNLIFYVFFWSGVSSSFPIFFNLVLKLVLLFGPLAYLYLKSITGETMQPPDLKHFYLFPFVALLSFLPFREINYFTNISLPFVECSSLLFYSILIIRRGKNVSEFQPGIKSFVKQYSLLFAVFALSFISYYVLYYVGLLKIEYDYAISISMSLIIYFIGYRAYFLPQLHTGPEQRNEKYERSGLTVKAEKFFADRITELMKNNKLYTNSELRLADLAQELDTSPHHVSQVINSHFKQSFSDFVNRLRVEASVRMIDSDNHKDETLIGIAYSCGFNNKVSFNNAFRKFMGLNPSNYRKLTQREKESIASTKYHPIEA